LADASISIYTRALTRWQMRVETLEGAAEWLRKHFQPEAARGLSAVVQLDLHGPGGGSLRLRIAEGDLEVASGNAESPDVRLQISAGDCYELLAGRENAELLFMDGRMEIEGQLGLAMKLRTLFPSRP
jgi:putative sterol carrier protein